MRKITAFLTLLMLFAISASAQHTIYINNQTGWDLKIYGYGGTAGNNCLGDWGGLSASSSEEINGINYLLYNIDASLEGKSANLIFNNGNDQLGDEPNVTFDRDYCFTINLEGFTENEVPVHPTPSTYYLYVENLTGWSDQEFHVYGHADNQPELFGGWPGLTASGHRIIDGIDYLLFEVPDSSVAYSIIFNNGNSGEGNQFDYEGTIVPNQNVKIKAVKAVEYQSELYMTGLQDVWNLADTKKIPHVGNGVYKRTFTSPTDFTGDQQFKISQNLTEDWTTFDAGVFQPEYVSMTNATQSYTLGFNAEAGNIYIPECLSFTVTIDTVNQTIRVDISNEAKMPLSRADFDGGRKHYFFVGTRTNDFRLQPEWELTPANGYTIAERLVYPGMFAIAVVDNYDDYIYHRFKMFANIKEDGNGFVVTKDNHVNIALSDRGDAVCITTADYQQWRRPYNYKADNEGSKVAMLFNWTKAEDVPNEILFGMPVLAHQIALTLDADGNPATLSFNNVTDEKSEVAQRRMFAPCGAEIYYADESVFQPSHGTTYWYNHAEEFHQVPAWANAWVQYDTDNYPYVDGYGRYLAQTVYQYSTWMKDHPTRFMYPEVGNMAPMPYSSNDIVFVHYSQLDPSDPYYSYYLSKADKGVTTQIGAGQIQKNADDLDLDTQNPWYYTEELYSFGDDNRPVKLDPTASRESAHWEPYVVSDIWLYGEFKIWAGTSGGPRYQARATVTDEGIDTDFLWYPENGGVDLDRSTAGEVSPTYIYDNESYPADGVMFTMGKYDSFNNYNFKETPKYFKRVILWYDADNGLGNSLIQFLGRYFAPTISISKVSDNMLSYYWEIPISESKNAGANLVHYTIERYRLDDDTKEPVFHGYAKDEDGNDVKEVAVNKLISAIHKDNEFATLHSSVDNTELPTGTYFYVVKTNIHDTTNDQDRNLDREATSTRATIVSDDNTSTGVDEINVDAIQNKTYYDLRGVRVENPVGGTFIEVINGVARKVRL